MMDYLQFICCPKCASSLTKGGDALYCNACATAYQCVQGIPVLIDLDDLPAHFAQQIRYFEKEMQSDFAVAYSFNEWQKNYIQKFVENFTVREEQVLIDCGTGSGYMAIELARLGATVIACDLTLNSLLRLKSIALQQNLNNIYCICCSADNLPFRNNIADYFISNAVLEHIPNEGKSIQEINRVCKEKAGLMIAVPLRYRYLNPVFIPINFIHDKKIGHLRRYDSQILKSRFHQWKLARAYYTGHFKKVIKVMVNLFISAFDERKMEKEDRHKENIKWGSSNIIAIFKKNNA